MTKSLLITVFFISGIFAGLFELVPDFFIKNDLSTYALYLLMFLVGVEIGAEKKIGSIMKNLNIKVLLVPLSIVLGSLTGATMTALFINDIDLPELLAVSAGFGYYSLSSVFITQLRGDTLGVIALMSNLSREIFTLLFAPFLARYFGKLAPIASGGATSMDTTLPVITKFSGSEYAFISILSGFILTILVPFLVTFILSF